MKEPKKLTRKYLKSLGWKVAHTSTAFKTIYKKGQYLMFLTDDGKQLEIWRCGKPIKDSPDTLVKRGYDILYFKGGIPKREAQLDTLLRSLQIPDEVVYY